MHSGCVSKDFVYRWWMGDKPTSRKSVKISKQHMWKQFFGVYAKAIIHHNVGKYPPLFTSTWCIIVLYTIIDEFSGDIENREEKVHELRHVHSICSRQHWLTRESHDRIPVEQWFQLKSHCRQQEEIVYGRKLFQDFPCKILLWKYWLPDVFVVVFIDKESSRRETQTEF